METFERELQVKSSLAEEATRAVLTEGSGLEFRHTFAVQRSASCPAVKPPKLLFGETALTLGRRLSSVVKRV